MQTQILDAIINNNGGDTIGNCQYIKIQTWLRLGGQKKPVASRLSDE